MDVALGVLLGIVLTASVLAVGPAGRAAAGAGPGRGGRARRAARRGGDAAASAPRPDARVGRQGHRRTSTRSRRPSRCVIADSDAVLAFAGDGAEHVRVGEPAPEWLRRFDRIHVEPRLRTRAPQLPFGAAVIAPLVVQDEQIGRLAAFYGSDRRLRPEDTRVVSRGRGARRRAGRAVGAGRAGRAPRAGRAARAAGPDLAALHLQRAGRGRQLDPHAARGGARAADRVRRVHALRVPRQPLLCDAGRRAALRREVPAARAGALRRPPRVRVNVAPEVLAAVVPVLSMQPLVENAVRHGVESRDRAVPRGDPRRRPRRRRRARPSRDGGAGMSAGAGAGRAGRARRRRHRPGQRPRAAAVHLRP